MKKGEHLQQLFRYIIRNKKTLYTALIFSGLLFFPLFLGIWSLTFFLTARFFKISFIKSQLLAWSTAIILTGLVFIANLKNYLFRQKRCFGSISEWYHEESYSYSRARAMYPPIRKDLLYKRPIGICLGRTGIGPFARYVCIDLNNKYVANHIIIIGTSSAGKSSGPILISLIVNFMNCDDDTPPPVTYLATDPKPELLRLSSMGGKWVRELNPMAPRGTSYGWNMYYDITPSSPLDKITDRIQSIVNVIVQDSNEKNVFFQESARNLLSGCLIYEFIVHGNNFIRSIQNILSSDLDAYVKAVKADSNCPKKVIMLLAEYGNENDQSNATADIKKTLKQQTAVFTRSDTEWFLDTDVNKMTCSPDCIGESISMILSIKRADLLIFGVLFRIIISQCSEYLSRREDNNPNDKPAVLLIDEFCNLGGTIPHIAEDLGFIRSKKTTYITVIQQYSQLQKLYGKEEAKTILSMGHQLILSCEDPDLGRIFSEKGGEFKDIKASYKNGGLLIPPSNETTFSETKEKRVRLMDDLTSLYPRFESIAFINGSEYIGFNKYRYYMNQKLRKRSEACASYHALRNKATDSNYESEVLL